LYPLLLVAVPVHVLRRLPLHGLPLLLHWLLRWLLLLLRPQLCLMLLLPLLLHELLWLLLLAHALGRGWRHVLHDLLARLLLPWPLACRA
jgi:hypothetical protein